MQKRQLFTLFLFLTTFFLFVDSSHAATIQVTTEMDEYGEGAACSLREAIRAASTDAQFGGCEAGSGDDEIQLQPVTYSLVTGRAPEDNGEAGDFDISSNMAMIGNGATIQSDGGERVFHVFPGAVVRITGVTIENGKALGEEALGSGGCISNRGNLTLRQVTLLRCEAITGGGIYNGGGGILFLDETTLRENQAQKDGGGLLNYRDASVAIINSTIDQNRLTALTGAVRGGGIANYGTLRLNRATVNANRTTKDGGGIFNSGNLTINNSILVSNSAGANGGGISNSSGTAVLSDTDLVNNSAARRGGAVFQIAMSSLEIHRGNILFNRVAGGQGIDIDSVRGGGIYTQAAHLIIFDSILSDNRSVGDGGGIANSSPVRPRQIMTVERSTLTKNESGRDGGGIFNNNAAFSLANSTLFDNKAPRNGGGIFTTGTGGVVRIQHATIARNIADRDEDRNGTGGGLFAVSDGYFRIHNTIVAGNFVGTDSSSPGVECLGRIIESRSNIFGHGLGCSFEGASGDSVGEAENPLNPFGSNPLSDNGGRTPTIALSMNSGAVDTGNAELCLPADQRGEARQGACDIGAYEARCGDGNIGGNEACDDGADNADASNACRLNCSLPRCGDGIEDTGEACDDGNPDEEDACHSDCSLPGCGDGIRQEGEECDLGRDGNSNTTVNACRANCVNAFCGDRVVDEGEECDQGREVNNSLPNVCRRDCRNPRCGDGIQDQNEACDDGNMSEADACSNACVVLAQNQNQGQQGGNQNQGQQGGGTQQGMGGGGTGGGGGGGAGGGDSGCQLNHEKSSPWNLWLLVAGLACLIRIRSVNNQYSLCARRDLNTRPLAS